MEEKMIENEGIMVKGSPLCTTHQKPLDYICDECFSKKLSCGDCLLDFHSEHMKKVKKIKELITNFQKNCTELRSRWQDNHVQEDQLLQMEMAMEKQQEMSKQGFGQEVFAMVNTTFMDFSLSIQKYLGSMKDPQIQYQKSKTFFETHDGTDIDLFYKEVKMVEELNAMFEKDLSKQQPIQLDQINIDAIKAQMDKHVEVFFEDILPLFKKLERNMNQVLASHFENSPVKVMDYTWSPTLRNLIKKQEGRVVECGDGCEQQRFILSNETLSKSKISYFEVQKNHTAGCYDSFGVCTERVDGVRNGTTKDGWAVRLYGQHGDNTFTGKIHDNKSENFHDTWTDKSKVGILYNPFKKTLSYFDDGKFVGTAFTEVETDQELYICLECCHHGSFQSLEDVKLPMDDQMENLL